MGRWNGIDLLLKSLLMLELMEAPLLWNIV